MDKVLLKAKELSDELKKEPLVVEYLRVKEIFENDQELEKMRKEIAKLSSNKNDPDYKRLKNEYENHPLVSNYYELKSQVVELLNQIKDIII